MKSVKILICGINSQVGYYLSHNHNYSIFGTVRKPEDILDKDHLFYYDASIKSKRFEYVISTLKPDIVFNTLGLTIPYLCETYITTSERLNRDIVKEQIDVLKKYSPNSIYINCGSALEFLKSPSVYAKHKTEAHEIIREARKEGYKFFQPYIFSAEGIKRQSTDFVFDKVCHKVAELWIKERNKDYNSLSLGNINNRKAFIHGRDTARAIYLFVDKIKKGEIAEDYLIWDNKDYSIKELIELALSEYFYNFREEEDGYYIDDQCFLVKNKTENLLYSKPVELDIPNKNKLLISNLGWHREISFTNLVRESVNNYIYKLSLYN